MDWPAVPAFCRAHWFDKAAKYDILQPVFVLINENVIVTFWPADTVPGETAMFWTVVVAKAMEGISIIA